MTDETKPTEPTSEPSAKPSGLTIKLPSLPTSWTWQAIVAWILTLTGISITVGANITIEVTTTPEAVRNGWAGPAAVAAEQAVRATLAPFRLVGNARDNTNRNVRLWEAVRKVIGKDLPNYPQEIGDCVGHGAKNAAGTLACVQLAGGVDSELNVFGAREGEGPGATGPPLFAEFREPSASYIYGVARVPIAKGRFGRGDGATGLSAVQGMQQFGLVSLEETGPYSGKQSREWGAKGPPQSLLDLGKQRLIRTFAPIRTPEEARDALCNGYPITVASYFGTRNFDTIDGRIVARGDDKWPHQMCCTAYDGSGPRKYFYLQNSWGADAHPRPLQGEPAGGFWITWEQMRRILSENDSFAISNFDGFPSRDLNFNVFGDKAPATVEAEESPKIKVPVLLSLLGVGKMTGTGGGISLLGIGGLFGFKGKKRRREGNGKGRKIAVIALFFGLFLACQGTAKAADPFNVFAAPPRQEAIAAASFNVFGQPPKPIESKRFDVFACEGNKSCDCLTNGQCNCGENCPCLGTTEEPITDYVEIHTRDGCGPCERFKAGPMNMLRRWKWIVGPTGHVRIVKHPPTWSEPVPQFRFYRHGKEFARRTGYLDEWQIAREFERREVSGVRPSD